MKYEPRKMETDSYRNKEKQRKRNRYRETHAGTRNTANKHSGHERGDEKVRYALINKTREKLPGARPKGKSKGKRQ